MARKVLNKSEKKALSQRLDPFFSFSKQDQVILLDGQYYLVNNDLLFFRLDNGIIPTVRALLQKQYLKAVTVDKGAVRFVANGADIMRPGIIEIDPGICAGDIVAVVDEEHHRPLAVGEALLDAPAMEEATSGKMVKTLHYVGDTYWNFNS